MVDTLLEECWCHNDQVSTAKSMLIHKVGRGGLYFVDKISGEWKKKHPHKLIILNRLRRESWEGDSFEKLPFPLNEADEIFVFGDKDLLEEIKPISFYSVMECRGHDTKLMPVDLNNYFSSTSLNVAFKLFPQSYAISRDPRYLHTYVICDVSNRLVGVDFRKSFSKIVRELGKDVPTSVEEWLEMFITDRPACVWNEHYHLPINIDEKTFSRPFRPKISDYIVGYCFRNTPITLEVKIISDLERQLKQTKKMISIYDNYDGIVKRISAAAKKSKIAISDILEKNSKKRIGIRMKFDDIPKLGISFSIIDFIC